MAVALRDHARKLLRVPSYTDYVRDFVREVADATAPGAVLLDAGAGECQYKPIFGHARYTAVDLAVGDADWDFSQIDVIAPLHAVPLPDDYADVILCTEVLEHVPNPREVVSELFRLCKPGGRLYVSVPFSGHEHQEPHDFYRYTRFGVRHLYENAGFKVDYVRPVRGDAFRLYNVLSEQGAHQHHLVDRLAMWALKLYLVPTLERLEARESNGAAGAVAWQACGTKPV